VIVGVAQKHNPLAGSVGGDVVGPGGGDQWYPVGVDRCVGGNRELRLTDEERMTDQAAATAVGESLSDFFRRAAANRAADILVLGERDGSLVARLADLRART
jgi:hypothetical protein